MVKRFGLAISHEVNQQAHELINTGKKPLEFYLIADNPAVEAWFYPDSKKWGFSKPRKIFRLTEVDYYDGEE